MVVLLLEIWRSRHQNKTMMSVARVSILTEIQQEQQRLLARILQIAEPPAIVEEDQQILTRSLFVHKSC
jgi:hypothetical protein